MQRYNPKDIESKWQDRWEADKIYQASEDPSRPKKYILEYFPYPSGAAMHVGHVRNYTIGDVLARFSRMQGYNVLHPMGWDAFGLPAENYAIKTGVSPRQAIDDNTTKFKQQLTQMGFSYDWSREIDSTDPSYYRWTQWFFSMLFKLGLAYQKESLQWWCPHDKTVLANEQVEAGKCWRCGHDVEKKLLKQWFFKITEYADRLSDDLDNVNWSDSIKAMQRNWIGKSSGVEIAFWVDDGKDGPRIFKRDEYDALGNVEKHQDKWINVFTTRPDTLYGVTFMVLSPEHPLTQVIASDEQKSAVAAYVKEAQAKSDIERQETNRDKTGVFTGAYAINPVNNERIPIWTSDYVLVGYGTGAIMAVPAHDERDYAFAKQFGLKITTVIAPTFLPNEGMPDPKLATDRHAILAVAHDPDTDTYCMIDWDETSVRQLEWPGGGIDEGETLEQAVSREFIEETGYTDFEVNEVAPYNAAMYFINHLGEHKRNVFHVARLTLKSKAHNGIVGTEEYEKEAYKVLWLTLDEIKQRVGEIVGPYREIYGHIFEGSIYSGKEGTLINSGTFDNLSSSEARDGIVAMLADVDVAREVTNYKMRDWLISRQRYWGAPIPIIHCPEHGAVAVPDDQLPVVLPDVASFEPAGDGRSPLATVADFVHTTCPTCGGPAERETDTMDGFACSSWYFLRFADPHNADAPFDADKAKFWLPVDDYIGGAEHAVMHLLYARFWTKVMHDQGMIDFDEPFTTLRNHGMILAPDGSKMSKSKGNTIEPGVLIDQGYGADSVRIMELFIGPWNQAAAWSVEGMGGAYRFLQRVWTLAQEVQEAPLGTADTPTDVSRAINQTIKKVTEDIATMSFNTAIASMMELVNALYKSKPGLLEAKDSRALLRSLVQLLAPFAPHISEELWQQLGGEGSIHLSDWPVYDESSLVADTMTIVVQINGKLRGELTVATGTDQESIISAEQDDSKITAHLENMMIKKTVYVSGKLVNFVV